MEPHTRASEDNPNVNGITVSRSAIGWEVRETRDSAVVRTHTYCDWHRVERAVHAFERASLAPVNPAAT